MQLSQTSKKPQRVGIENEIIEGLEEAEFDLNDVRRFYMNHLEKHLAKVAVEDTSLYTTKVDTFFNDEFKTRLFFGVVFICEPASLSENRPQVIMKALKEFTLEKNLNNIVDTIVVNEVEEHFTD